LEANTGTKVHRTQYQPLGSVGKFCHPKLHGWLRLGVIPGTKVLRSDLNRKKLGVVAHACHFSDIGKCKI
jgi:hypothetical protein